MPLFLWHVCDLLFFPYIIKQLNEHPTILVIPSFFSQGLSDEVDTRLHLIHPLKKQNKQKQVVHSLGEVDGAHSPGVQAWGHHRQGQVWV